MKAFVKYFFKLSMGTVVYLFGGVFFLKRILRNKNILFILNYHNFSKYNNFKFKRGDILSTDYAINFEKQIEFLKKEFKFCYCEDYFENKSDKGVNVLITFDDGYKDNYDIALPILKKHEASAVFFITTEVLINSDYLLHDKIRYLTHKNIIPVSYNKLPIEMYKGIQNYSHEDIIFINKLFQKNKPNKRMMLNSQEIKEIFQNGFKIGNHTHKHIGLSFYNRETQLDNIREANEILYSITGEYPSHFAYPNGLKNNDSISALKELNFKYAYSINSGFNTKSTNKFTLLRLGVNVSDNISTIVLKLIYASLKKGENK